MIYGYARVSTSAQSHTSQIELLNKSHCDVIYQEIHTRKHLDRPELNKLLNSLNEGDTLVVTKLDRLAGNTRQILNLVNDLFIRKVNINILNIGLIDNSTTGKLILTVLSAFAEFEVDLIKTRIQEGKEIARKNINYKEGRPLSYGTEKRNHALSLLNNHTYKEVSKMTGISVSTLVRIKKKNNP